MNPVMTVFLVNVQSVKAVPIALLIHAEKVQNIREAKLKYIAVKAIEEIRFLKFIFFSFRM